MKYKEGFVTLNHTFKNGYISLPIDIKELPLEVDIEGFVLQKKSSFHVSLVCVKRVAELISGDQEIIAEEIVDTFVKFVASSQLSELRFLDVYRLVKRDERVTVIRMVEVPGLSDFFSLLNSKFRMNVPIQPTHVTLYTLQPDKGIGILSREELERDSHEVMIPGLSK